MRRTLAERGLVEAVTFSFIRRPRAERFGGGKPELRLVNPISADLDAMRPSVLPGLVDAARRNADRGFPDVALFELGPLYRDDPPDGQANAAAGLRAGLSGPRDWREPAREPDLYDAKADALAALAAPGAPADNIQAARRPAAVVPPGPRRHVAARPDRARRISANCTRMCSRRFERERPGRRRSRCSSTRCRCRAPARARPPLQLSVFQPVERDFAFIVDRDLPAETLLRAARGVDRKLVSRHPPVRRLRGKGLPEGKKSLAISVALQPQEAHPDRRRDREPSRSASSPRSKRRQAAR